METSITAAGLIAGTALIFPFLYLGLFRQNISKTIKRFSFSQDQAFNRKFHQVLKAFLTGSNGVLKPVLRMADVREELAHQFPPFYRGFAYEGVGLGLGVKASLSLGKGRRFESYLHQLSPGHLYQYYVGLGWYLSIRHRFDYEAMAGWLRQLDSRYAPIVFDGVGFKTALYHYRENKQIIQKLTSFPYPYQRVCYQGLGRSLWFLHEFDLKEVSAEIETLPSSFRNDAFSGAGIAVAYSMFDQVAHTAEADLQIPLAYRASFRQGLAFGWEARKLQDPAYWQRQMQICPSSVSTKVNHYVDCVHQAEQRIEAGAAESYYFKWIEEARRILQEKQA
ncbi:DUF1702 family protein [Paenibacillus lutrae]|uniref:DUF1702 family protein n=1 Tax=Paenibacillus lutrae TaxID=2078573 RepID=A0A7X3FG78_9BACL|nr:DUF1702 family protein [Paenibacillus lutrae]MVO98893.1 DUF1702 family protein [Paenibacillus lutrae]